MIWRIVDLLLSNNGLRFADRILLACGVHLAIDWQTRVILVVTRFIARHCSGSETARLEVVGKNAYEVALLVFFLRRKAVCLIRHKKIDER